MIYFVKLYIHIVYFFRTVFSLRLKGLGYVQTVLKKDSILNFKGQKLYFKHGIPGSYDFLMIGKPNEPETHIFFNRVVPQLNTVNFIDIGASVGEMVLGMSVFKNVECIYAFEPRKECVEVLKRTMYLNNENRLKVFENLVSTSDESVEIFLNPGGTSSGIFNEGGNQSVQVQSVKLDTVLPTQVDNPIILVDVEGAEPLVLESGVNFISNNKPLIVFEYNEVSKKHFCLDDIAVILGENYCIYRLKGNGELDKDFSNSWNAVAVPMGSDFEKILFP